ncbi:MAG: sigma 54-interacting transcriptional regulator [Planctomycetota bacterium]
MSSRLWIREPSGRIREQALPDAPTADGLVIGRDETAGVVLRDPAVSRFHARLLRRDDAWLVVDLESSNRTYVNGDPIHEWTLRPGDQIGIGDSELHIMEEVVRATDDSQTQVIERTGGSDVSAPAPRAAAVLDALHELSQAVAEGSDEAQLLENGIHLLVERLQADRGAVLLLDADTLLCRAAHSRGGQQMRGFVLSQTIYQEVMQSRDAVLSRDTGADDRFQSRASVVGEEIRSVIAAPIHSRNEIAGILYLDRLNADETPFESEDLYGAAVAAEFLGAALQALATRRGLVEERENLVQTIVETNPIVGKSRGVQRVRDFIRRAAPAQSTVLILGDTGTGKELVAQAIHYQSPRRGHAFVAINCAAIPETLVESELFGHEKGSFTGAVGRKLGKFEVANQGTVFLDEVGELPLGCQAKLLRLLEEQCFERVGGTESVQVDVRIVAATNRDLWNEVEAKNFREDLYYRLNVLQVLIPSLAERTGDVELLIDHFLDHFAQKTGTARKELTAEARKVLAEHPWPGNIRQLRNAIESCVVMAPGTKIDLPDLPANLGPGSQGGGGATTTWKPCSIQDLERDHIERVLDHVGWNKSKAAEVLGIERSTLYSRIRNFGLNPPPG